MKNVEKQWKENSFMSSLKLINGSCADQKVDAVVNAANRYLAAGGGTSNESRGTSKYLVIIGGNYAERRV